MGSGVMTARSEQVRRHWGALIETLMREGDLQQATELAELATARGLWRDPLQRPPEYVSQLDPVPVHDPADFWFVDLLETHHAQIREELDAVEVPDRQGFLPVEEPLLGAGRWEQVTFWEAGRRSDAASRRFPVTSDVISQIPEATTQGPGVVTVSWLWPGTRIVPHCGATNARLRVHLGITVPQGPWIRVGDRRLTWQEGRCLVFDDSFEHEVSHEGSGPRVVLLMDVLHPRLDPGLARRLLARRGSSEERLLGHMVRHDLRRVELDDGDVVVRPREGAAAQARRYLEDAGAAAVELVDGRLVFERA